MALPEIRSVSMPSLSVSWTKGMLNSVAAAQLGGKLLEEALRQAELVAFVHTAMQQEGKLAGHFTLCRQGGQEFQHQAGDTFYIERKGYKDMFVGKKGFTSSIPFLTIGEIVEFPGDASFFQPFDE